MHKTTASGHNLSLKIPDGPSLSSGSGTQPEHPMFWGMQLRYVSCVFEGSRFFQQPRDRVLTFNERSAHLN